MKKLFLLLIPLLLSGCYDYNELNDLAIVSGVAIDYEDDTFKVAFEILSTKKEGETSGATSTYNTMGEGKSIVEAFDNNGLALDKIPYYEHIEVVIISEDIAKEHFKEVSELLIRNSKMRNEFYTVIAHNVKAQDILLTTSKEKPIASSYIAGLLEHSSKTTSSAYYAPFTDVLSKMLTKGEDARLSTLTIKEDNIVLDGMGVFKDFKLEHIFNEDEASIINLIDNFKPSMVYFANSCNNNQTIITSYDAKIDAEVVDKKVVVKGSISARIQEDECGYDLKNAKSYQELEKIFKKIVEDKIKKVIKKTQELETNTFSLGKKYYNKTRKEDYYIWCNQDIEVNIDVSINKKGLIFEVE